VACNREIKDKHNNMVRTLSLSPKSLGHCGPLTSCKPRPSAARRLSKGMVKPFGFFQFEMHGGIFHSFCSFTDTLRGGECSTGGGGDGGPTPTEAPQCSNNATVSDATSHA